MILAKEREYAKLQFEQARFCTREFGDAIRSIEGSGAMRASSWSQAVAVVVKLDTRTEQMHRVFKGTNCCDAAIVPAEDEGYVIEGFEGLVCRDYGKRIRVIRILAD